MGKVKANKVNYAVPGKPMEEQELQQMIQEAEKGNFHSMQAVKQKLTEWKSKYVK